ncbi:TPA: hypothetical protein ACPPGU_001155 [Haemophilus influenzae]|uniref:hypothetical protein n=1 Tax=Haemophilus TaxID=724 RepID=UPI00076677DE|nr:hypothetical protein [Haemophilus influenzae]MCK8808084.1 hypothetical protein [Haemophilus influenzae]MCK9069008.1 hypothetical protein [Haemophilus influenzae]MCK9154276.1 hypothetical protein [Haemophilus influenzae]OMP90404.1 hypothetical protein BV935_09180 [Haemophilus influenzae]PRI87455.1 hypothetical protein BV024_01666 [Haemophilus influenzae]
MSNKTEPKVRVALEVEMFESQRDALEISSKTKVLEYGRITRFDWEGDVFNEVDTYRQFFDLVPSKLMVIATQYEYLKDENFTLELQLAIKRAITPIIKAKRKAILEGKNE